MSKLLIALFAVVVTSGLAAQTAPPCADTERTPTGRAVHYGSGCAIDDGRANRAPAIRECAAIETGRKVVQGRKDEARQGHDQVEPESRELLGPGGDVLHARTDGGAVEGGIATKHRAQHEAGTATARERTSAKVDSVDRMRICHQSLDESNGERYA